MCGCSCQDQNGSIAKPPSAFSPRCFQAQADVSQHLVLPCTCLHPLVQPHQILRAGPRSRCGEMMEVGCVCAVCCRWHGACGRTDRALCRPAIGHPEARGSMPAFTSVVSALCFAEFVCIMHGCQAWIQKNESLESVRDHRTLILLEFIE